MADAAELMRTIKRAALDAVRTTKPAEICYGTVTSISPLKINVEQKLILGESQLLLTKAVKDHWVDIEVNHQGGYKGRKKIMIYNGLLVGEKVLLLRIQGGQQYIVVDRMCDHTVEGEWL